MMNYYTSPDNGKFWQSYLDKSFAEGNMTKEIYDKHCEIHNRCLELHKMIPTDNDPNLEKDLRSSQYIHDKCVSSETYCRDLYSALCNNRFVYNYNDKEWDFSWRYAGGIISDILEKGEYLDWYCSGNEGNVTDEVRSDLIKLGWSVKPYEDEDLPGVNIDL